MEAAFASTSDTVIILDELSQLAFGEAAIIVYALTGGRGKQRLKSDASARTPYTWRTILWSTGEQPLSARIDEDRQKLGRKGTRGGTTVRVIDIPVDPKHGVFNPANEDANFNPAEFAEELERRAQTYYGAAGPAFVEALIKENITGDDVRKNVEAFVKDVLKGVPRGDGQVRRVAARFALVAVAGVQACAFGILDWDAKTFVREVKDMLRAWLTERGSTGAIETMQIIQQARNFFEPFGESRFDNLDDPMTISSKEKAAVKRAGYRKGQGSARRWYVFPGVFRTEIFEGVSPKKAAQVLFDHSMLEDGNDADGRFDKKVHQLRTDVPTQRFFVVKPEIFEGFDGATSPQLPKEPEA
jgi:uncharacterized protein (DUF927 family)